MDNYYSLLEVSLAASPDEIKKAYHRLAKVLHPDKNPNDANATASFQRVCYVSLTSSARVLIYKNFLLMFLI